jgi:hypothetical protein
MSDIVVDEFLKTLTKAARPRRPSERNRMIHQSIRLLGKHQRDVAAEFGVSQPRVSAIVKQVERWRSLHTPAELDEPQGAERQRLDRWLARQRYETLYVHALRFLEHSQRELMTISDQWKDGTTEGHAHVSRSQRAEAQWMRIALQATKEMLLLGEWEEPEANATSARLGEVAGVVQMLTRLRQAAVREGRVADEGSPRETVEMLLRGLVGEQAAADAAQDSAGAAMPAATSVSTTSVRQNPSLPNAKRDKRDKCDAPERQNGAVTKPQEARPVAATGVGAKTSAAKQNGHAPASGRAGEGAITANITVRGGEPADDGRAAMNGKPPATPLPSPTGRIQQPGLVPVHGQPVNGGAATNPQPRSYLDFVSPPGEQRASERVAAKRAVPSAKSGGGEARRA